MEKRECPFCGKNNIKFASYDDFYYLKCYDCGATGPKITTTEKDDYHIQENVVENWNERISKHNEVSAEEKSLYKKIITLQHEKGFLIGFLKGILDSEQISGTAKTKINGVLEKFE